MPCTGTVLFISWGVKPFSSVKINKIQHIGRVHITVHIYCLITCNIRSLLNVPIISQISRKFSQVFRFLAKSPDSWNKFVFLPKQPLLELSRPGIMQMLPLIFISGIFYFSFFSYSLAYIITITKNKGKTTINRNKK